MAGLEPEFPPKENPHLFHASSYEDRKDDNRLIAWNEMGAVVEDASRVIFRVPVYEAGKRASGIFW
jgi:hypothetical protein